MNRSMIQASPFLFAVGLACAQLACGGGGPSNAPKPVAAGGAEASAPPPTVPEEELEASEVAYAYSPIGKRDPFRSIFEDLQEKQGDEKKTELQKFDIDQLKPVAVVTGRAAPYAMVEDPTGKGHTLTRGTLIGKNWGRVSAINKDCIIIKEEYRDYTGRRVANEISMCLPKPQSLADALKLD
ncbi:MAG: pilus assembly protein PilP [Deltaproteobacteria bacterium]|nr:pilus assembly protein PilP [Deltaproteobacteria bacterium]